VPSPFFEKSTFRVRCEEPRMKKYFIAMDGGTTNTRIALIQNGDILDILSIPVGAGANAKAPGTLQSAVKDGIALLLRNHALAEADVERILASGMVTSELGLYTLAHLSAPVGIEDLCKGLCEISLPQLSSIPFVFVPGVKTEGETLAEADMMRGEETELVGLCDGKIPSHAAFVLPGSHSKIIVTDECSRIASIKTMLTGEMLAVLSEQTVLRGSFSLRDAVLDLPRLEEGFAYADENGLGDALFKVRVLKTRFAYSADMLYSFFLGAILRDEIRLILRTDAKTVYVGGKVQLRTAITHLLSKYSDAKIIAVEEERVKASTANGLLILYKNREAN